MVKFSKLKRTVDGPNVVYQYLAGNPQPGAKDSSIAIEKWLTSNEISTKIIENVTHSDRELHPLNELMQLRGFVLILHDSGNESLEEYFILSGIVAPIMLLHYTAPRPAQNALSRWGMAALALGMDPTATLALRASGFYEASSFLLPEEMPPPRTFREPNARFGVVVPGDLTAQSHALTILHAFARFQQRTSVPSKLVFLGRTLDPKTAKMLHEDIQALKLEGSVTITGALNADLEERVFEESDLCVLLDPPQEPRRILFQATLSGLAVIAPSSPSIVFNIGEAGLKDNTPPTAEVLTNQLIKLVQNPSLLERLVKSQRRSFVSAHNDEQASKVFWNALGRCGLAIPIGGQERKLASSKLSFIVAGHFEGSYSIAAVNRLLAVGLEQQRPDCVSIVPVVSEKSSHKLHNIPTEQAAELGKLLVRKLPYGVPVIAVSQYFPPWLPDFPHDLAISLFTWEETLVPPEIVDMLNLNFDGVVSVSHFVAKSLIDAGVRIPVGVVGQAVDIAPYITVAKERAAGENSSDTAPFTALHVSSCFPRKGVDILLSAWAAAFTADDPVRLVIKTFPNPHNHVAQQLENLRATCSSVAPVELIERDLELSELTALYRTADCMVLPTRGEGFNMVAAEAILSGLPLIVTEFGGHLDFLQSADVRLIDFTMEASNSHVTADGALWAKPDQDELASALREAAVAMPAKRSRATSFEMISDTGAQFSTQRFANRVAGFAEALIFDPPPTLRRVAWISSWGVRCGIAEYSKALLDHRPANSLTTKISLLCDNRTIHSVDSYEPESVSINSVWQLGGGQIATEIQPLLKAFDPQLLLVQHQAGLVGWRDLLAIIELKQRKKVSLVVLLHSTESMFWLDHKLLASILFALSLVERVIVHTLNDSENLRKLGLSDNITILPHGAAAPPLEYLRLTRKSKIIGCYGFFLPHKGIAKLIEAFAFLRIYFPSARLRLVNAIFPSEISLRELRSCHALARRLQVFDGIDWHTDYLDDESSKRLLADCDIIVLPYDQTPESASGAVRQALGSGCPVAVSDNMIFAELGDAVHRVNATDVEQLGKSLQHLLNDPIFCRSTLQAAADWLGRHNWNLVSKRLFNMMEGLFRSVSYRSFGRLVLCAAHRMLGTQIGLRTGRNMVFVGGPAGFGIYGPYATLFSGDYKLVYRFNTATPLSGTVHFDVHSLIGDLTIPLGSRVLTDSLFNEYVIDLYFSLPTTVLQAELRMFCEEGFLGALESLSIQMLTSNSD